MRHRLAACLCASLPTALAAQAPTFVARSDALFAARFDDVPAIAAALPKTRLGRLLAQTDVAAAWATGAERLRAESTRTALLLAKAIELQIEANAWHAANHADRLLWSAWAPI